MTPEQIDAEIRYRRDSVNQPAWTMLVPVAIIALAFLAFALF